MKGIIFNLLEDFITRSLGEDSFEEILSNCGLLTPDPLVIVAPGTYPDQDFHEIVRQAAKYSGSTEAELLRSFGRFALPRLAERYPHFFSSCQHPKDFLKFLSLVHHVEIKKLYKDADTPLFSCRELSNNELILLYSSKRKLCHMVEGLIQGLEDYYLVKISCHRKRCMLHGDNACEFLLRFQSNSG